MSLNLSQWSWQNSLSQWNIQNIHIHLKSDVLVGCGGISWLSLGASFYSEAQHIPALHRHIFSISHSLLVPVFIGPCWHYWTVCKLLTLGVVYCPFSIKQSNKITRLTLPGDSWVIGNQEAYHASGDETDQNDLVSLLTLRRTWVSLSSNKQPCQVTCRSK